MNITIIPKHYLDDCWDRVAPLIQKSIDFAGGRYDLEYVKRELERDMFQLWIMFDGEDDIKAAVISQVVTYPMKKVLVGTFVGGEDVLNNCDLILEAAQSFGRQVGCDTLEIWGRPGWKRALKKIGFSNERVCMERSI